MDGADVVKRFWHMPGCPSHCFSVFNLGGQHIFLHMPCKSKQKGKQHQQYKGKSPVGKPDDRQNTDDLTCIRKHADNAGCEQVFHGIHISHKSGNQGSRFLASHIVCSQIHKFFHKAAAKGMSDLLAK